MKNTHLASLLLLLLSVCPGLVGLEIGSKVDAFSANTDAGELWQLSEYIGEKNIVVYFYPAAMTGGCTKQACAYRDQSAALNAVDAVVVGVSGDAVNGLALFKQVNGLNFALLSDVDGNIAQQFGVDSSRQARSIEREVDGVKHVLNRGVTSRRWTFVIGKDGTVIYKNDKVKATEDASEVIGVLKKLG